MVRQFNNLRDVENYVTDMIMEVVTAENSYSKIVLKEEIQDVTIQQIYDRYDPKYYKRRGDEGGMSDMDNIRTAHIEKLSSNSIRLVLAQEVKGNFPNGDSDLAPVLNEGWGDMTQPYQMPSYHLDILRESLGSRVQSEFVNAMKFDLKNKGINIR